MIPELPGRARVVAMVALLALGPRLAAAQRAAGGGTPPADPAVSSGQSLTLEPPPLGAIEDHGGAVWYRLSPPFADPRFQTFAFEPRKNTWLALGEVLAINLGIWFVSYWAGNDFSKIGFNTIRQNFNKGWIVDTDPYWVNQFGHPYEGAAFYTAARSTGHGFYESFGAAFLGSLFFEQFMEVQSPAVNDQITTSIGGTLLGEVLYRMNRLVLDSGGAKPGGWREAAAFLISPVAGVNRWATGDRYRGEMLLPPSWMGQFHLGMVIGGSAADRRTGATNEAVGPWGSIGAHILYGVPGTRDLRLRDPLDHFDFSFMAAFTGKAQPSASLLSRGLVVGDTFGRGEGFGGLWGLFGVYDAIGVPVFKASGVGVGPGVSLMNRWGWFELHGTALAALLPWAGGGSMEKLFTRDYHYGPGAQGVLELRGHFSDRATFDLAFREYWISGAYATGSYEDLAYLKSQLTVRVHGPHAVSGAVNWARRHASYPFAPDISQDATIWSAYYTLLQGW
jgi:hypothetical protein